MAPVGEVSPVWISLHTTPLPGRFGVGGFGRLGGMYCVVCELPRALSKTPRIEIPTPPQKSAPRRFRSRLATIRPLGARNSTLFGFDTTLKAHISTARNPCCRFQGGWATAPVYWRQELR